MARITSFRNVVRVRQLIHEPTDAEYSIFEIDGQRLLQVDTTGSRGRKLAGKVSQSIQLDRAAAEHLHRIIGSAFGLR